MALTAAVVYVTGWWGVVPFKTKGPNNTPGVSIRTTHFPTPIGVYDISELVGHPWLGSAYPVGTPVT